MCKRGHGGEVRKADNSEGPGGREVGGFLADLRVTFSPCREKTELNDVSMKYNHSTYIPLREGFYFKEGGGLVIFTN